MYSYSVINDEKYSFISSKLKTEVLLAGRRKIIFVESYDDKRIFEIFYSEYSGKLYFIEPPSQEVQQENKLGYEGMLGCEGVKKILQLFVEKIANEKRFFGVIDRDLNTDEEIANELSKPCYDGRLYIFCTRYTIENYLVESQFLLELLKDKKINIGLDTLEQDIIKPILENMFFIALASLTIRFFNEQINKPKPLFESSIDRSCLEQRLVQKFKDDELQEDIILKKFNEFMSQAPNNRHDFAHKFASAKVYFDYQFNQKIKQYCRENLNQKRNKSLKIEDHKFSLARIAKEKGYSSEFKELLDFIIEYEFF